MDIVVHTGRLMQSLNSEDAASQEGLSLLSGVFCMPVSTRKTVILPWSPLASQIPENIASYSFEDLFRLAKGWIIPKFPDVVAVLDDTLSGLWKSESHRRCISFLTRGR